MFEQKRKSRSRLFSCSDFCHFEFSPLEIQLRETKKYKTEKWGPIPKIEFLICWKVKIKKSQHQKCFETHFLTFLLSQQLYLIDAFWKVGFNEEGKRVAKCKRQECPKTCCGNGVEVDIFLDDSTCQERIGYKHLYKIYIRCRENEFV